MHRLLAPRLLALSLLVLAFGLPRPARAAAEPTGQLWTEAALAWQSRNDVAIPADTGTRFSLTELGTGPLVAGRIYTQLTMWQRHELRALWAPLSLRQEGSFDQDIVYQDQVFAAGSTVQTLYRFNSYRLTYRYAVVDRERTSVKVGFTGKLRDAEIAVSQDGPAASRVNLGFVPLLHLAVDQQLTEDIGLLLDVDALWSPYGRAEDVALFGTFQVAPWARGLVGYRTVEGGSDGGGNVYTFAWLHYAALGLQVGGW